MLFAMLRARVGLRAAPRQPPLRSAGIEMVKMLNVLDFWQRLQEFVEMGIFHDEGGMG